MGGKQSKEKQMRRKQREKRNNEVYCCLDNEGKEFGDVYDLLKEKKYEEFEKIVAAHPDVINLLTYENHFEPTMLIHAVEYDKDNSIVEYLSKHEKCDIAIRDQMGNCAFFLATGNGNLDAVKWLLHRDSSILNSLTFPTSPLSLAAINGYKEIVELFLQQDNIDLNLNYFGRADCQKDFDKEIVEMVKKRRKKLRSS